MKKIYSCVLLLASLLLFIMGEGAKWNLNEVPLFHEQPATAFAETIQSKPFITEREFEQVVTLTHNQPIYMKQENLVRIGELQADQAVAIIGEDEEYYEIRVGKMPAFIRKGQAKVEKNVIKAPLHTERLGAVKTAEETPVYSEANRESGILMQLREGYRYPVVQEENDWYIIKVGERAGYIHKSSAEMDEGLPVLLYHQVLPRKLMKTEMSTISLEKFEEQMAYLANEQFTTLTSQELYDYLEGRLVVPEKALIITFDDGLLSSKKYAYPVLKQHGFTSPHHIISSRLDRGKGAPAFDGGGLLKYLDAEDLKEMTDVFQFEAHTCALHELGIESGAGLVFEHSEEEIIEDLKLNLHHVPSAVSIAYPYGQYNDEFIAAAKEVGLLIGYTTVEGYANMDRSNYEVNRFGMTEKRSFKDFATYVDGDMRWP
ncbi:polysaccharide deacetylase family protein [Sporosarcina ureae]|uniref:polysaccharide deacetylase family protein n=1 Tax=Sporosarcina ureae TaxID=1571 RepID=UPI0026ED43A4|nr:polysaccharide deacetylase family protein [Sporosarcina ureae]